MDSGEIPEQFGVILLLDPVGGLDLGRARRLIAERIAAVPRLRQRLIRTPFGCGGPVWVDDAQFDICNHVREVACGEPGDEPALLDTAMAVIAAPLRRTAPLWSVVLVTGIADGAVTFGGLPVTSAIPASVAQGGNITVYFEVLSYAGTLTLAVITDPDHFPDPGTLTDALRAELDQVVGHPVGAECLAAGSRSPACTKERPPAGTKDRDGE
jgi:hypothetical protein